MIQFNSVSFSYENNNNVLSDITFTINKGESVGLIGANGAGKSTLMNCLLGILPCEGEILVNGMKLGKNTVNDIRKQLGLIMQNSDNQMFMPTVYEDMLFGPLNYGVPLEEAEAKVDEVLNSLEMSELKYKHNHKLSGGEKRMAAIATVLAMSPDTILMDEPTSALDPFNRRNVINVINKLDNTKVIASHDLDMIMDTCERVILLSKGKIVADGPSDVILNDKDLLETHKMELPLRCYK